MVAVVALVVALFIWWVPLAPAYDVPADTDVFAVAAGTWDWTTVPADSFCIAKRHTIAFSPDRRVMTFTQSEPWTDSAGVEHQVAVYDISEHSRRHIRGQIRGESRLTSTGEPVVWDLVLRPGRHLLEVSIQALDGSGAAEPTVQINLVEQ